MKESLTAGGIILNPKGEIALVTNGVHEKPWWGFPKGHVDEGEDVLNAACREITEETGLVDIELVRELPVYQRFRGVANGGDDTSEFKTIRMFLFTCKDVPALVPQDPGNPEARWVHSGEVGQMLAHPKDREYFASIRAGLE